MAEYGWTVEEYSETIFNPNVIDDIDNNQNIIYLTTPVVNPIEQRYGGGEIVKYTHDRKIEFIGLESLRIEAQYDYPLDDQMPWAGVQFLNTHHFWVRQVTGAYLGRGIVDVSKGCHYGTIEDCAMVEYRSIVDTGHRYGFEIDDAAHILFQRCYSRTGRHDFSINTKCPGPNAFVDCSAEMALSESGPHNRWSMGFLWDNVKVQQLQVRNRRGLGSGHGWAGVQHMQWNCESIIMSCEAPPGNMNWSVGSISNRVDRADSGFWESHNEPVTPRSLYYTQLRNKRGSSALQNVLLPQQLEGNIWQQLNDWGWRRVIWGCCDYLARRGRFSSS